MSKTTRAKLRPDLRWLAFDVSVGVIACSKQHASVHLLLATCAAVLAIGFLLVHWAVLTERGFTRSESPASVPLSACSHSFAWTLGLLLAAAYWNAV